MAWLHSEDTQEQGVHENRGAERVLGSQTPAAERFRDLQAGQARLRALPHPLGLLRATLVAELNFQSYTPTKGSIVKSQSANLYFLTVADGARIFYKDWGTPTGQAPSSSTTAGPYLVMTGTTRCSTSSRRDTA